MSSKKLTVREEAPGVEGDCLEALLPIFSNPKYSASPKVNFRCQLLATNETDGIQSELSEKRIGKIRLRIASNEPDWRAQSINGHCQDEFNRRFEEENREPAK